MAATGEPYSVARRAAGKRPRPPVFLRVGLARFQAGDVGFDMRTAVGADAPLTLVIGEPGSGKTYFLRSLTRQARVHGVPVVVVDPLTRFLDGERSQVVANGPGSLDPFLWCAPGAAAQAAGDFLLAGCTEWNWSIDQKAALLAGLQRAASRRVPTLGAALEAVADEGVVTDIHSSIRISETFAQGISFAEQARPTWPDEIGLMPFRGGGKPDHVVSAVMRLAVADAIGVVTPGGMVVIEEAWLMDCESDRPGADFVQHRLGSDAGQREVALVLSAGRATDLARGLWPLVGRVLVTGYRNHRDFETAMALCDVVVGNTSHLEYREYLDTYRGALGGRLSASLYAGSGVGPVPVDVHGLPD